MDAAVQLTSANATARVERNDDKDPHVVEETCGDSADEVKTRYGC